MYPSETEHLNDDLLNDSELLNLKKADRGFNKIYRKVHRESDDKSVFKKIELYTTGGTGSNIRDAETGEYYSEKVGTKYEDLYFKVSLATGECTSLNGSNTLFYLSPQHYEKHLYVELDNETKVNWEEKKQQLLYTLNQNKTKSVNKNTNNYGYVTVK
jgi:hypothetical protein